MESELAVVAVVGWVGLSGLAIYAYDSTADWIRTLRERTALAPRHCPYCGKRIRSNRR